MADGSVIGQGTVVRGNVRGEGSIEIYGRVEGDVDVTGDVTLGDNAVVRGSISGARLTIAGGVQGDLTGSEGLLLGRAAQVKGDLTAPTIGIEEGAQVRGSIRTGQEPASTSLTGRGEARSVREKPAERPASPPALPKRGASPPPAPAKKRPPAPVVPAIRRGQGKKKKARRA